MTEEEQDAGLSQDQADLRIAERSSADQLVGAVTVIDADGNEVPMTDDNGDEILGIATGEEYMPAEVYAIYKNKEQENGS